MKIENMERDVNMDFIEPSVKILISAPLTSISSVSKGATQDEIDRYIGEQFRLALEEYKRELGL